ncbi:unnamed protein product [Mycena citricolor]|uniref:HMG box domain-containing protein n=1 Tax=Mycena citricolor TaxID=2018698 RepID=A0AAD2K4M9_9AGAR|nr:unnamed protein product [Mycena citricolor]
MKGRKSGFWRMLMRLLLGPRPPLRSLLPPFPCRMRAHPPDADDADDMPPLVDAPALPDADWSHVAAQESMMSSIDFSSVTFANRTHGPFASTSAAVSTSLNGFDDGLVDQIDFDTDLPPVSKAAERRAPSYIPRPPNAFILFRSHFIRTQSVPERVEGNHSVLSKIVGKYWKALQPEERAQWEDRARAAQAEHRRRYPDWRFRPGNVSKSTTFVMNTGQPRGRRKGRIKDDGGGEPPPPPANTASDEAADEDTLAPNDVAVTLANDELEERGRSKKRRATTSASASPTVVRPTTGPITRSGRTRATTVTITPPTVKSPKSKSRVAVVKGKGKGKARALSQDAAVKTQEASETKEEKDKRDRDNARCEKIANLLVEGKSGPALAAAVAAWDADQSRVDLEQHHKRRRSSSAEGLVAVPKLIRRPSSGASSAEEDFHITTPTYDESKSTFSPWGPPSSPYPQQMSPTSPYTPSSPFLPHQSPVPAQVQAYAPTSFPPDVPLTQMFKRSSSAPCRGRASCPDGHTQHTAGLSVPSVGPMITPATQRGPDPVYTQEQQQPWAPGHTRRDTISLPVMQQEYFQSLPVSVSEYRPPGHASYPDPTHVPVHPGPGPNVRYRETATSSAWWHRARETHDIETDYSPAEENGWGDRGLGSFSVSLPPFSVTGADGDGEQQAGRQATPSPTMSTHASPLQVKMDIPAQFSISNFSSLSGWAGPHQDQHRSRAAAPASSWNAFSGYVFPPKDASASSPTDDYHTGSDWGHH